MKSRIIQLPFAGRLVIARDVGRFGLAYERQGAALHPGGFMFGSELHAELFHNGKSQGRAMLGSGMVTNVGALAMANDGISLPGVATNPVNLMSLLKFQSSGTSATAAAMTDIKLNTPVTTIATPVVTATNSLVSAANLQKWQSQATITYDAGGPYTVTEWGLFTDSVLSVATGSPFTAGSATTGTVTGTPLTASSATVQGHTQHIVENTGNATPHWGLITQNSTSVFTVPAWYKVSDGTAAGVTPANTNAYVIRPVMWDRKQFTGIGVSNGDAIQFTYLLTMTAGG